MWTSLTGKIWEQKLFEAKQEWVNQADRMGHKDVSKDSVETEIRLTECPFRNFERIAAEGFEQARAVNDPVMKVCLQYKRQEEFCKQTSGDLPDKCLASLDQMKMQMEMKAFGSVTRQ